MKNGQSLSPLRFTSHVAVLFGLIVVVLITTMLSGLQTFVMPCIWPLVVIAVLVPLGNVLNATDDAREKLHAHPAGPLQPLVSRLCDELHIHPPTLIEATDDAVPLHTVGGARRSLIIAPSRIANRLAAEYLNPNSKKQIFVEAILFHELQHVVQKDVRWLAAARALLVAIAEATVWVGLMAAGLLAMLQVIALPFLERFAEPHTMDLLALRYGLSKANLELIFPREAILTAIQQARGIEYGWLYLGVVYTLLPFAIGCVVLAAVVWVRMVRVRELYADAAVAEKYGSKVMLDALNYFRTMNMFATASTVQLKSSARQRWRSWRAGWLLHFTERYHPSPQERKEAQNSLAVALTKPLPNGLIIGTVALLLSVLTSGAASVLVFGSQPTLLPLLVVFAACSVLMTPAIAALPRPLAMRRVLVCIGIALAMGMIYVVLNMLLTLLLALLLPGALLGMTDLIIRIVYGFHQSIVTPDDLRRLWQAALATLISTGIGTGLVVAAAYADVRIKHALLHAEPPSSHLPRRAMLSTLGIGAGLAFALAVVTSVIEALLR